MAEFDQQYRNQDDNRENNHLTGPNPTGKVPEYNFWAEQIQGGAYSNYNPRTNTWEYRPTATDHTAANNNIKKQKKGRRAWKFVLKSLSFGVIAAICFIAFNQLFYYLNPEAEKNNLVLGSGKDIGDNSLSVNYKIEVTQRGSVTVKPGSIISDVSKNTKPSIVSITSMTSASSDWFGQEFNQPMESSGSGIIVGKDEGELLIATNNHVVAGAEEITVTFIDGKQAKAEIKGTDANADLAVITVDISTMEESSLNEIKVAKLGNSDETKVGEMSIAIGNALGYGQSVTVGYISAKDREVEVSDGYDSNKMVLLQTDAAINPGNSGGALLNTYGEVIGINTVKYASYEVEGMGYAIPISKAIPIINELMSREVLKESEQGYLGITGGDVTEDVSIALNIPIGVYINEVTQNGAAHQAGLLKGDVITRVNEIEVTSITQLKDYVNSRKVGTEVQITYMRIVDGVYEETVVAVTLKANPYLTDTNE
ncbi:MAG: hypothetical protein K0S76_2579 [Herbinix sp.]|nr:hypothetical protein [Herbinix sp.]